MATGGPRVGWGLSVSLTLHLSALTALSMVLPRLNVRPGVSHVVELEVIHEPHDSTRPAPVAATPAPAAGLPLAAALPQDSAAATAQARADQQPSAAATKAHAHPPTSAPAAEPRVHQQPSAAATTAAARQPFTAANLKRLAHQTSRATPTAPASGQPSGMPQARSRRQPRSPASRTGPASPPPTAADPEHTARRQTPARPAEIHRAKDGDPLSDGSVLERVLRKIAATTELTQDERRQAMLVVLRTWEDPSGKPDAQTLIDGLLHELRRTRTGSPPDATVQ